MKVSFTVVAAYALSSAPSSIHGFSPVTPVASTHRSKTLLHSLSPITKTATYNTFDGNIVTVVPKAPQDDLQAADMQLGQNFDALTPVVIQGGALRTWSFPNSQPERVLICLNTEGRHLTAKIDLNEGPDNTPQTMDITIGKGKLRPFKCMVETPNPNTSIFVRNTGPLEYPISASLGAEMKYDGPPSASRHLYDLVNAEILQGGAIRTWEFDHSVSSVKVALQTDGRPLNARVELIQGPDSNKVVINLYTEDGILRPFFTILSTPGYGNVVRVVNTASMEFPLTACVDPYVIETTDAAPQPAIGFTTGGR